MCDARPEAAHPLHDGSKIHRARGIAHAEGRSVGRIVGRARRADERLGRHAPVVEAVSAHQIAFYQRNLGAQPGRPDGGDQTRGTGADHDQIVATAGGRVDPLGRVDAGHQLLVVRVPRRDRV